MRLGVFGGTFDPPHHGHLLVASDAFEHLQLDRVLFVPNARQPLKAHSMISAPEHRLAMVELAVADDPRFDVCALEIDRGGMSYMADTLTALASRFELLPLELTLLLGADSAKTLRQWRSPEVIGRLARVAVMRRGGEPLSNEAGLLAEVRLALAGPHGSAGSDPVVISTRRVDISSTEVRERVRSGLPIRGFVPDAVAGYIAQHGLYHTRLVQ